MLVTASNLRETGESDISATESRRPARSRNFALEPAQLSRTELQIGKWHLKLIILCRLTFA
jgi:hypothetical protein